MIVETLMPFPYKEQKDVFQCSIFKVTEKIAIARDGVQTLKVYSLTCSNWVNIVPVTSTGEVVFVEQYRFGSDSFVLEVPGGAIHFQEKDSTLAAVRELEEETGLTSKRLLSLTSFLPNPAIQNNRIYFFIAFDVQPAMNHTAHEDPFEEIKVHLIPIAEALKMARNGQIPHALSALALLTAEPYLKDKFPETKLT